MNRFSIVRILVVGFAMLFLAAGVGFAQTSNGAIAGGMTDKTGAAVPGATVAASSTELGEKRSTTTDGVGTYRIESLLPGKYMVVVTASGFAELKVSNVDVRASSTSTVNGVLEVASVAATITVEAGTGQLLQTQSGDITHSISKVEINNLPIFGLSPIALALTQPGVLQPSSREDFTNGVGFSVNGTRPRANNFLIDGQDNNDNAINGQAFQLINLEAISEVTILTNSYSSEFGRGGGSVTNLTTKGGTNAWHGSAYDLHRNSALAAIPAELKLQGTTKNPVDIENVFGYSFGGPIKKNKLFLFQAIQWDRDRTSADGSTLILPTAAGVTALQGLGTNSNVAFLINSLGGLRGQTSDPTQVFTVPLGSGRPDVQFGPVNRPGVSEVSNDRQINARIDWNASQSDVITGRYVRDDGSLSPDFFNFPGSLPPFDSLQGGPSYTFGAAWVHTFSARAVNEFRFSITAIDFTFGPTSATAANPLSQLPAVSIADIDASFPTLGFPTGLPQGRAHKNWQYQDGLTYTIGSHTFKGGVDISHLAVIDGIPFNSRGTLGFTSGGTCGAVDCTALANYVDNFTGPAGTAAINFGNPVVKPFVTTYAPYFQDTWRIRPNFTLDLGMRYEYWGVPENVLAFPALNVALGIGLRGVPVTAFPTGLYGNPEKSDRNNFAPRVGFAYTPRWGSWLFGHDKTVIRAGYGIFYDGLFTNILDNTASGSPNTFGGTFTDPGAGRGTANATGQIVNISPTPDPTLGVTTVASNLVNPLTQQWNFNIQRELPGAFVLTAAYVGTRGERLFVNQEFNPRVGNLTGANPRFNTNFGPITVRSNAGDSIYHSAQLKVDRKFTKGLLLRGSYTYSKLIDDGSEVFTTSGRSSFAQNPFNQEGDRGLSAFDRRHRGVLTYIWELPYVHSSDNAAMAVLKAITRDWQTAGTISFQSGAPDTITSSTDTNRDGRTTNDRPSLGNPNAPFNSFAIDGIFIGGTPGVLYDGQTRFFGSRARVPTTASAVHFLIVPGLGNVGRNTVITPGRQDWNMSIQRIFKMPFKHLEQQQLLLRAEFFNAFNHPNLGINGVGNTPTFNLRNSRFATVSDTRFGGRQIKFLLRYSF